MESLSTGSFIGLLLGVSCYRCQDLYLYESFELIDEGGNDFYFCDVGNRIPHLKKLSNVATEELGRFLIDAIQIMLGAWPSTRSHVVVGESRARL